MSRWRDVGVRKLQSALTSTGYNWTAIIAGSKGRALVPGQLQLQCSS